MKCSEKKLRCLIASIVVLSLWIRAVATAWLHNFYGKYSIIFDYHAFASNAQICRVAETWASLSADDWDLNHIQLRFEKRRTSGFKRNNIARFQADCSVFLCFSNGVQCLIGFSHHHH